MNEIRKMISINYLFAYLLIVHNLINFTTTSHGDRMAVNNRAASGDQLTALTRDNFLIARCRSICSHQYSNKTCEVDCIKDFLDNASEKSKPGECPRPYPSSKLICPQTCGGSDYGCPDTQKCCIIHCGKTCRTPIGLDKNKHLPPIPRSLKLQPSEEIPHRQAIIQWEMPEDLNQYSQIFSVVQSRSHIGTEFSEAKLNKFHPHLVLNFYEEKTPKHRRYAGIVKLNPGRWYQFRVAVVNEFGTKGYSNYTKEFQLSKKPKPPRSPRNVTLDPFGVGVNNTLTQKIYWNLPKSDMPLQKYKISWSLYIKDVNESLLKETAIVLEPKRNYEIRGLAQHSMYYLQIQAISLYGDKRLKSEPATKLINTTITPDDFQALLKTKRNSVINTAHNLQMNTSRKKSINHREGYISNREFVTIVPTDNSDFKIKFVMNKKFGFIVRTEWTISNHERIRVEICNGTEICLSKKGQHKPHFIVTKKNHHDFTNLKFNQKYTVGFKLLSNNSLIKMNYDYNKTFTTPTCESYRKSYKNLEIKCHPIINNHHEYPSVRNNKNGNRVKRKNVKKNV